MEKTVVQRVRLEWVDYAKGIAILLVVLRHTVVGFRRAGVDISDNIYMIQEWFYNVRMPVFFILSGVFLGRALEKKAIIQIFREKVSNILYPYILWAVVLISFQIFFSNYANTQRHWEDYLFVVAQPRELDHMWYLLALFNTTALMLLSFFLYKKPLPHLAIALLLHYFHYCFASYSLVSDIMYNYIFLVVGVYSFHFLERLEHLTLKKLFLLFLAVLPIFIVGQLFWLGHIKENYDPLIRSYQLLFLVIIFVASIIYYLVSRILSILKLATFLSKIGKYSLYIYVLHVFVLAAARTLALKIWGIENQYFLVSFGLISGIILPIVFYRITSFLGIRYLFSLDNPKR